MTKFKVGDKVKLNKTIRVVDYEPIYKGTKGEIVEVRPKKTYNYVVVFQGSSEKFPMLEADLVKRLF